MCKSKKIELLALCKLSAKVLSHHQEYDDMSLEMKNNVASYFVFTS
jgi:hypothetical protein